MYMDMFVCGFVDPDAGGVVFRVGIKIGFAPPPPTHSVDILTYAYAWRLMSEGEGIAGPGGLSVVYLQIPAPHIMDQ